MYSDTHFHFSMVQERCATSGSDILAAMAQRGCAFALDVGTKCDDLGVRRAAVGKALSGVNDAWREAAAQMVHYSAGVWPQAEAIADRENQLLVLEHSIEQFMAHGHKSAEGIIAIGECGIDHHWNPTGADRRSEADFDKAALAGERELFEAQLDMARRMKLPIIVHSRDAFAATIECIKNVGYDRGVIHCFSYGLDEVKAFLERGWYIAFGGGVTYTKPGKMEALRQVVLAVSDSAILLETDAPYLAPVPMRGKPNTPLYIDYTYKFIADIRGVSSEELSNTVDNNCRRLFENK